VEVIEVSEGEEEVEVEGEEVVCMSSIDAKLCGLKENGWCVVSGVLTPTEVEGALEDFWEWAEEILGVKRGSEEVLRSDGWFAALHGIIKHYGVGQSKMMWKLRLHPGIQALFRRVWGCNDGDDLITSFDGCSVVRPPEGSRRLTFNPDRKPWFHVDQTPGTSASHKIAGTSWGLKAVQGGVNLYDSDEDDACFYILTGSHVYHEEFFVVHASEWKTPPRGDFFMLSEAHIKWYESKGCTRMCVPVKSGSVTLWDSRLVHCSKPPNANRAHASRWRLTAFVCMMPRALCPPRVLERRKEIVRTNRTTCHWPNQPRVNAHRPRATHLEGLPVYKESEECYVKKNPACLKLV
jgi:hypothetical protein